MTLREADTCKPSILAAELAALHSYVASNHVSTNALRHYADLAFIAIHRSDATRELTERAMDLRGLLILAAVTEASNDR